MVRYLGRRLPSAFIALFLASIAIFLSLRLLPGDPALSVLGEQATPESIANVRRQLGLDLPLTQQYWHWVSGLATGDLGVSLVTGAPLASMITRGMVATLELAVAAMILTCALGFLLGMSSALARRRGILLTLRIVYTALLGVPEYILGIVLIMALAIATPLLPAGGRVPITDDFVIGIQYLLLPAIALSLHSAAVVGRFLDAALRSTLSEGYIEAARARGVSGARVALRHALPNAAPAVLTVLGLRLGHLLGGAVVIEAIFNWHGLGQVLVNAVNDRDYRLVQDLVLFLVAVFIAVQVLTDVLHSLVDPRTTVDARTRNAKRGV